MARLRITVDWPEGLYHGVEWPPSPWRVYQALVAGSAMERRRAPELEAALRHLEALPAPVVTAPRAAELEAVRAPVPDNDGDVVLALHAKGKPAAARKMAAKLASFRTRTARRFEGPVTYEWEASAQTAGHFQGLARLARSVSAVGQGIDLALARAELLDAPSRPRGVRYTPSPDGRLALGVPWPGGFDALEARYRRERSRIGAGPVATRIEASPRRQGYRSELELPRVRWAAFSFRTPDGRPLIVDGARTVEVAAMVRHAIHHAAKCLGLDAELIRELMGHGGDGRISVQPLPNVGYLHADGRIRRVLLVAPECVDGDAWRSVVSRLAGAALVSEASGEAVGMLAPIAEPDPMLDRYRGEGRCWTSATPVVLPGYDSLRGRLRPERSVRKLLHHAGVAEVLLERAAFERGSRLRGSAHPLSYRRPGHPRGIRACTSASSGRSRSGARSRSARASGTGSGSSSRWEKNSSAVAEVTLKEVEPACVRAEGDGIHSGPRT